MKIKLLEGPHGLSTAVKGARLPFDDELDETKKGDSYPFSSYFVQNYGVKGKLAVELVRIGPKDKKLIVNLIKAGDSHSKVMRMIVVWLEITASRKWWVDFVTYRLGVEGISKSTMHKILTTNLLDEHFDNKDILPEVLAKMEELKNANDLESLKNHLPEGYLQTRCIMLSYQALRHIYLDRKNHKLKEFKIFLDWIKDNLKYAEDFIFVDYERLKKPNIWDFVYKEVNMIEVSSETGRIVTTNLKEDSSTFAHIVWPYKEDWGKTFERK